MAEVQMVKLSCGCKIRFYPQNTSVTQCALHAAAPDLLEALKNVMSILELAEFYAPGELAEFRAPVSERIAAAHTAISKAAGQPAKET